jgi:hypothetical protein
VGLPPPTQLIQQKDKALADYCATISIYDSQSDPGVTTPHVHKAPSLADQMFLLSFYSTSPLSNFSGQSANRWLPVECSIHCPLSTLCDTGIEPQLQNDLTGWDKPPISFDLRQPGADSSRRNVHKNTMASHIFVSSPYVKDLPREFLSPNICALRCCVLLSQQSPSTHRKNLVFPQPHQPQSNPERVLPLTQTVDSLFNRLT